jgi:hypothetical protein
VEDHKVSIAVFYNAQIIAEFTADKIVHDMVQVTAYDGYHHVQAKWSDVLEED